MVAVINLMNVHPGFTTHPKFLAFKRALGAPEAAEYLLRIWEHCQLRQKGEDWGKTTPDYVEEIAGWRGQAGKLWTALTMPTFGKKGFVQVKRGHVLITGWEEHNSRIVTAWRIGALGGRPKTTRTQLSANPTDTRRIPDGEPIGVDRSGVDRSLPSPPHQPALPEFQEPTLEQVREYASLRGIQEECAVKWFWSNKATGWIVRGAPIVDWKASLHGFSVAWRAQEYLKKPGGAAGKNGPGQEQKEELEAELQGEKDPEKRKAIRQRMEELSR